MIRIWQDLLSSINGREEFNYSSLYSVQPIEPISSLSNQTKYSREPIILYSKNGKECVYDEPQYKINLYI